MTRKVYCDDCKYLSYYDYSPSFCIHQNHSFRVDTPTHYFMRSHPIEHINSNNDCNCYKRKWWKFWVKENS